MTSYIYAIVSPTGRSRSSLWGEVSAAKPDTHSLARASDEYDPAFLWPTGLLAGGGAITRTDSKWNAGVAGEPPYSSGYPSGGFQWFSVGSDHVAFTKIGTAETATGSGTTGGKLHRALLQATDTRPDTVVLSLGQHDKAGSGAGFTSQPVVLIGVLAGATRWSGGMGNGGRVICEAVTLWWSSLLDPVSGSTIGGVPAINTTIANTRTWLAANP